MTLSGKLVIVGCGMAGAKLVEELLRIKEILPFEVTIIGDEPGGNYDRIRLADWLKHDEVDRFWLNTADWFEGRGVMAKLQEHVTRIDRTARMVHTDKGNALRYDALVLATGAASIVPPMEGSSLPGVFTLRNLADVLAIKRYIEKKRHIAVIGGGLLGLELADVLHELGKEVTVCHLMASLMERQLAPDAAAVLEKHIAAKGIEILKSTRITTLCEEAGRLRVLSSNSESFVTDAVVINCGIRPNKGVAMTCGLDVNCGIVVSNQLRTSDADIYAIGECAEFEGHTYGLLAPVYAQARALAQILTGHEAAYRHTADPVTTLKSEIATVSMGQPVPGPGDDVVLYDNPKSLIYKKLIIHDNHLVGATLIGDHLNADAIGGYYASQLPLPRRLEALVFPGVKQSGKSTNAVYWPGEVAVCDCNGITCGAIREGIRRFGNDIGRIKEVTRAAINCGTCLSRVEAIAANTYDVVIVGAGLGGLACGARLSQQQRRVLIIEQHDRVGGYASSFSREGYTFDVSLHNMGPLIGPLEKMFDNLGLNDRIEYLPFDRFQRLIFPEHDFIVEKGLSAFTDYLTSEFPEEKAGIEGFMGEMQVIRQGFEEIEELTLEKARTDDVTPLMVMKYPQFAELVMTTLGELIDRYVKDTRLKGIIGNIWWYLGLPPSETASLLYAVVSLGYINYGGGVIKGTSQNLSNALADIIRENGGKVLLETKVSRILISDGKVDGVITDEGAIFYADTVVSNAGVQNTFADLVDETVVSKKFLKRVKRVEGSISGLQLYLGLDCPPRALGIDTHSFTWFPTYDHDESFALVMNGEYDKTLFSCTAYTNFDDSQAPQGKGIINIFSLDHVKNWEGLGRSAYEDKKRRVTDLILRKAEKIIPGLGSHVVVSELATPMTMKRYTLNPEGSIFGPSQIVFQSGLNRFKPDTPIRGLYLVGASIYPGGGYPSVISSGYRTAKMILGDGNSGS